MNIFSCFLQPGGIPSNQDVYIIDPKVSHYDILASTNYINSNQQNILATSSFHRFLILTRLHHSLVFLYIHYS